VLKRAVGVTDSYLRLFGNLVTTRAGKPRAV